MANPDPIPDATLRSVAAQLGEMLAAPAAAAAGALGRPARPELTESLAVCFLTAEQVTSPPADLAALARPSGTWHHQVRTAAGPTHLARSSPQAFAADELRVDQWLESPVAAKLDDALAWVDRRHPDDATTVRLLVAPAYYLHALLIVRGRNFSAVLVDKPDGLARLEYEREYPLRDFLRRLAREPMSGSLTVPPRG
jgi:hypothetical protein